MTDLFQPKQVLVPGLLSSEAINEQVKQYGDATRRNAQTAPIPDAAFTFADQIAGKAQADAARETQAAPKPPAAPAPAGASAASRVISDALINPIPGVGLLERRLLDQFGTLSPEESAAEAAQRLADAKSAAEAARIHIETRNKLRGLTDAEAQAMGMPVDPAGGLTLRPLQGSERLAAPDGSAEMTEYTRTVQDGSGQWMVVPSLWTDGTKPSFLETDDAIVKQALDYENRTGNRFPRFADLNAAEDFAARRSAAGGVGSGTPLARPPVEPPSIATSKAVARAEAVVRGEAPAPTQKWWLNAAQTAARSEAETVTGALRYGTEAWEILHTMATGVAPKGKSAAREWLDAVDAGIKKMLPGDPGRSEDFLTQLSSGAGSFVGFLLAGYVGETLGLPAMLSAGALGAATEGDAMFREAEGFGATDLQKYMALLLGSGLGLTEAIPIDAMLKNADTVTGGGIRRLLRTTAAGSISEFLQEVGQEFGEDLTAKYGAGYDPKRQFDLGKYATGGAVAALLGGFGGLATAVTHEPGGSDSGRPGGGGADQPPPPPETVSNPAAIHPDVQAEQGALNKLLGDAAPAEGLVAPVEEGRSNVSFEAAPGEGSPAAELLGERFAGLPAHEQAALTRDMTTAAYGEMARLAEATGDTKFVQGIGGWMGGQAPSAVASFDDAANQTNGKIAANMLGYLLQQTEVWASSVRPFGKGGAANAVAIDLIDTSGQRGNDGLAQTFRQVAAGGPKNAEGEPLIQGFQPITTPDGRDGIRILAGDGPADVAALREYAEAVLPEKLDDDITIRSGAADVYKARNDWTKDKDGNGYLSALRDLGRDTGPELADARQRLQDQFGQSLDRAEQRGEEAVVQRDPQKERADRIQKVAEAIDPPLPGLPAGSSGGVGWVQSAARAYADEAGITFRRQAVYTEVSPERGKRIADAYTAMEHRPYDPDVKEAYDALIDETLHQYQFIKAAGIAVEPILPGQPDPYPGGSKEVIADLRRNHLWFFPTDQGFGTINAINDNPLLIPTGEFIGDRELLANDVFRIVHDVFGHGLEGAGFGARGEENAWQAHVRLYSPLAAKAMTTETRGQNSWVNFGPHGEANRANPKETVYADQKTGLLPDWVRSEGLGDDIVEDAENGRRTIPEQVSVGDYVVRPHPSDRTSFVVERDGERVGEMSLSWRAHYATSVSVKPGERRKGAATALYDAVEQFTGERLMPSPLGLTDDAMAFWKRRLSKMEPEEKQALLEKAVEVGVEAGVGKSALARMEKLGYRPASDLEGMTAEMPKKDFDRLLSEMRARREAREAKVAELAATTTSVRMSDSSGHKALVGPNTVAGQLPFRVTYFGTDGIPSGHSEYATYEKALDDALIYYKPDDGDIEAMIAYHGSPTAGITSFRPSTRGAFGPGVYFGREELARRYAGDSGTVYPADIKGRLFSFMPQWVYQHNKDEINGRIQSVLANLPDGAAKDAFNAWWKDGSGRNVSDVYDRLTRGAFTREQVSKAIADAGYSGIEGLADGYEIVVFDPANAPVVRSEPNNPDIEAMTAQEFYSSPLNTLDELYAAAEPDQRMLDDAARDIARETGTEYKTPGLKKRATAEAKISRKGYRSAGQITDIVRGGFLVRAPQEADAIVQLLAERFALLDEGWKMTPEGYADRKLLIRFDNGLIGEIQLLERRMFAAKEPTGHALYEEWRALPVGDARRAELAQKMVRLYAEAAAASKSFWSSVDTSSEPKFLNLRSQASLDSSAPVWATSPASTADQSATGVSLANAADASSATTAGRLSQLTNFMNASDTDIGIEGAVVQGRQAPFKAEPLRPRRGVADTGQAPPDAGLSLIGKNLVALMGLTVRQGRLTLKGSQIMGQYSRKQAVIRLRNSNDLSSLAHEAGHALHDSMAGPLMQFSRANDRDLARVARDLYAGGGQAAAAVLKPGSENREGFAEMFRLFVTNPAYLDAHYPTLAANFRTTLQQSAPDLLAGLEAVNRQYNAWLNTSSVNALRTMVTRPRKLHGLNAALAALRDKGFRTWMQEVGRKFVTEVVDRTAGLRYLTNELLNQAERNLGAPLDLARADDPTTLARLAKNVGSRAMVELTDGVMGYRSTQPSTRSLREALLISQGLGSNSNPRFLDETRMQDFDTYLVALRALDEYRRFREGKIDRPPIDASLGDVKQAIKDLDAIYGDQFRRAAEIVHEYGMGLWRKAWQAGLMDDATYADGLERQFYAPLQRDMTDRTANLGLGPTALNQGQRFVKRFKGSDRDIISPMTALMHKTFALEKIIAENDVKKALAALADKAGQAGALVERVPAHQLVGRNVSFAEAAKALTGDPSISPTDAHDLMTILQSAIEDDKAFSVFRAEQTATRGENIVFYWDSGKLQAIQIMDGETGADVVNMLNGIGRENLPMMTELIALSSTAFRASITSWPDFLLVNFIRDQVSSWVLNDTGFKPFVSGAKGVWAEVRRKQAALHYNAAAGIMGGMNVAALHSARVEQDIGALRRKGYLASAFNEPGIRGAVAGMAKMVELTETGTRIGLFQAAFERAKAEGLTDWEASVEASYIATDNLDFGLNGSRMTFWRRTIPFLNAQLQGLYKMMRTLGGGEAAQRKGLMFALTAYFKNVNAMPLSRVEKQALRTGRKAWVKMASLGLLSAILYYMFKDDPDYQDASEYLRVTGWVIPTGDGRIFYIPKPFELAMVANIVERGLEAANGDPAAFGRLARGAAMTMTPPTAPPAILSFVEYLFNKDLFTGQQIVPDYQQALEPQLQYNARTSELAKAIGRTMNWSPLVVDHFLSSLGASAYRDITWAANALDPNRPASDVTDQPLLRRFVRDARRGAASSRDFWNLASTINGSLRRAEVTYKTLLDGGNEPAANRYLAGLSPDEQAYALLMNHFEADAKRINPFYRGRQITTVLSALRREMTSPLGVDNTFSAYEEPILLTAKQKHDADEILSEYGRREIRNTLIATRTPGWADKALLPTEPTLDMLDKVSPELREEVDRRLAKAKVYNGQAVFEYWPEARDRLIQDRSDAILTDLVTIERVH